MLKPMKTSSYVAPLTSVKIAFVIFPPRTVTKRKNGPSEASTYTPPGTFSPGDDRSGRRPLYANAAKTDMDTVVCLLLSSVHGRQVPGWIFLFLFFSSFFFFSFPDRKVYHITPLRDEILH